MKKEIIKEERIKYYFDDVTGATIFDNIVHIVFRNSRGHLDTVRFELQDLDLLLTILNTIKYGN